MSLLTYSLSVSLGSGQLKGALSMYVPLSGFFPRRRVSAAHVRARKGSIVELGACC